MKLKKKVCPECKKKFTPKVQQQSFCKIKCRSDHYREKNKDTIKKRDRELDKVKRKNPEFSLKNRLRCRLWFALKKYSTKGKIKSSDEYGINYKKIIEHLKPFPKNIENYDIDHIIPLSYFNFNNKEEIKWAFAPENH